jgi:hypothetical protein
MAALAGPGTTASTDSIARHLGRAPAIGRVRASMAAARVACAKSMKPPRAFWVFRNPSPTDFIEAESLRDRACGAEHAAGFLYAKTPGARRQDRADQRHVHACRPDRRTAGAIRHSPDLYDALYSSADTKVSKASGGIFDRVTRRRHAPACAPCRRQPARRLPQSPRRRMARDALADPDALLDERHRPRGLRRELWQRHRLDIEGEIAA